MDTLEGAEHEAGDLLIPISRGEWSLNQLHAELGEILVGSKTGRLFQHPASSKVKALIIIQVFFIFRYHPFRNIDLS